MTKATKIRKNTIGNEKKSSGKLSIKMRIAFWYTGLIIGITALFIITMLNIGSLNVRNAVHNRLKRTVEKSFERIDFIDGEIVLDNNLDTSAGDIFISVYDKNGDFIYGDLYLDLETGSSFKENNKVKTVKQGNLKWYVYEIKRNFEGYGDLWIRGVTPISQPEKSAEMTIFIFLALFPFLIIISASGGYIITKKAFEPIEDITKTAEKINKGNDLSERINIGNGKDEIFTLANTFDEMFDRLQGSFDREVQFTSDVSHELRTPISVISTQSEYGLKYLDINEETKEIFQSILEETKKMSGLVSNLLMLARMDKGYQKLNVENTNLSETAEIAIETQRPNAEKRNITIKSNISGNVYADIDESMIMRVFINLLSNAVFYGKDGGNVSVDLFAKEDKVICKITDDGIGISEEHIDKIWNRFYRADFSRTGDNSGLGLSMVKGIIEAHKGKIQVQSELHKGTVFTFELPVVFSGGNGGSMYNEK
ncbi:sensor histidine kinase [Pseudoleptotrichia goodfellowii]|jgi:Signal transduction histidine kinase|uniref:histidine kinase n=1 Tax=Pseudoleptotrichia goodfellowii F0264 TaxID=596323 RepID=D0GNL6_9FUSO|nr:HAMP domain-containing sensor histidine kinase [Pseudoleptotrichia goodfellowii]EEY34320.1 ATPase/histidine kinase/DNA gyrase B/HSP90 domain protein [Pseudoleptotrichia goodfellowii F0264]